MDKTLPIATASAEVKAGLTWGGRSIWIMGTFLQVKMMPIQRMTYCPV